MKQLLRKIAIVIILAVVIVVGIVLYFSKVERPANNESVPLIVVSPDIESISGSELPPADFSLTSSSTGVIRVRAAEYNEDESKEVVTVVFQDVAGKERVLAYLDTATPLSPTMQLDGSFLFFVAPNGQLAMFNLITKKMATYSLPGVDLTAQPVELNDFSVYFDRVFYLAGENCKDYRAECNLSLREYIFPTGVDRVLATNVTTRDILGTYNGKIYLQYADGDAGCFWEKIQAYDSPTKALSDITSYSDCGGEPGTPMGPSDVSVEKIAKELKENLADQMQYLDSIVVKNGEVTDVTIGDRSKYPNPVVRYILVPEDRD